MNVDMQLEQLRKTQALERAVEEDRRERMIEMVINVLASLAILSLFYFALAVGLKKQEKVRFEQPTQHEIEYYERLRKTTEAR